MTKWIVLGIVLVVAGAFAFLSVWQGRQEPAQPPVESPSSESQEAPEETVEQPTPTEGPSSYWWLAGFEAEELPGAYWWFAVFKALDETYEVNASNVEAFTEFVRQTEPEDQPLAGGFIQEEIEYIRENSGKDPLTLRSEVISHLTIKIDESPQIVDAATEAAGLDANSLGGSPMAKAEKIAPILIQVVLTAKLWLRENR